MKAYFSFIFFLVLIFHPSCQSTAPEKQRVKKESTASVVELEYANSFRISYHSDFIKLQVCRPWVGNKDTANYYLITTQTDPPTTFHEGEVLELSAIKRIVCLSTTHVGFLSALKMENLIRGVSGGKWINNPKIKQQIESGQTREVGMNNTYNYETLIDLDADVVFAFGINEQSKSEIQKLKELGIPVVLVAEFMEQHPLGKAEWIKFFGEIVSRQEEANLHFSQVKTAYLSLKAISDTVQNKPSVFTGLPWKGDWYVPGGHSFQALLFKDAGASYLWKDDDKVSGMVVDIETVIDRALDAEYWLNLNDFEQRKDVSSLDQRYDDFRAFKQGNLFNNNARKNENNGNDYWESGAVRPDLILRDLLSIFHPEIMSRDSLYYYQQLY